MEPNFNGTYIYETLKLDAPPDAPAPPPPLAVLDVGHSSKVIPLSPP
jgi:hypothetical protein